MGQSAQQTNQPTQVYYDPEKGQYFSYKNNQSTNPLGNLFGMMGLQTPEAERNYFGNSLASSADRFTPKTIAPNYPEMNQLFPALNAGLAQNLQNSLLASTDNTQSSGAGRFLAPSTSSKGK